MLSRGWLAFVWCAIGMIVGQLVGQALEPQWAILNKSMSLGFPDTKMNLGFVVVTLGILLKLSIGGAAGLVIALWFALRKG